MTNSQKVEKYVIARSGATVYPELSGKRFLKDNPLADIQIALLRSQ